MTKQIDILSKIDKSDVNYDMISQELTRFSQNTFKNAIVIADEDRIKSD